MDNFLILERPDRLEKLLIANKEVLTFEETCDYTGISRSNLYKLTASGNIPHSKPNGKMIFFEKRKLNNWLLRNYALVTDFIENGNDDNKRQVAVALRPMLKAFVRVTCPRVFPPGSLLGHFIRICLQRENTPNQIFSEQKRTELRSLLDYTNQFHHDTNPAWQTQIINDQELLNHARRTISFISL